MAEIEITGKQIGQLDPLGAIDGSEKIPVETADGNGHVTTQQMREYAQPDLSGYATKEEIEGIGGVGAEGVGINAEVFNNYSSNVASGMGSHAEGASTTSSGANSHAEGQTTTASGDFSHAEGRFTTASGMCSHTEGYGTRSTNDYEHGEGVYNVSNTGSTDAERTRHSVGIGGERNAQPKNAWEIMANGDAYLYGVGGYDGTNALSEQAKTLQEVVGGIPDTSQLATKEELGQAVAGKVTGTGVSAIEVVSELPAEPQDGVMYVVMG